MSDTDDTGREIASIQDKLESDRATLDSHCEEIAELVLPSHRTFHTRDRTKGDKRTQKQMESTAPLALMRYASAIKGWLVPRGQEYHKLKTSNEELNDEPGVSEYFDDVTKFLFRTRYEPRAGFDPAVDESLLQHGAFGTNVLFVDGRVVQTPSGQPASGMAYRSVPFSQTYLRENAHGEIDYVHRRFRLTASQAVQQFGEQAVSDEIREAVQKHPMQEFDFLHCVRPNDSYRPTGLTKTLKRYESIYVERDKLRTVRRSGYNTLRYAVGRGPKGPFETYGRSPAMTVLPDIKTINEMRRTLLRAQHREVEPPWGVAGNRSAQLRLVPNAVNPGLVSTEGRPLAIPLSSGARFQAAMEEMEQIRSTINNAFLITLFQILVDQNPNETATATLQRAKERAVLVGPVISQLQTEFLGQIIESEMDILAEFGVLPEMPEVLAEASGEYMIEYDSEITRALDAGEIEGYAFWLQENAAAIEIDPALWDTLDHESILRKNAARRGIDAKDIRSPEQLAELRAARAQQQASEQQAANAPALAQSIKTTAEADKIMSEMASAGGMLQ